MEKITNYKMKDFLKLDDEVLITNYLVVLDNLNPIKTVTKPIANERKKTLEIINIQSVNSLSFGEVTNIRRVFNNPTIEEIFECVGNVTGLEEKDILNFTIIDFYGIISSIKHDILEISNMESNELYSDDFDIGLVTVRANERMSRFGILNTINSLAGDDVTKWEAIEKLPYMVVFTKMIMDKERADIQRELAELQKKNGN